MSSEIDQKADKEENLTQKPQCNTSVRIDEWVFNNERLEKVIQFFITYNNTYFNNIISRKFEKHYL